MAYHPQTNGLVEHFNHTLADMLAKTVAKYGHDWDTHLPYVLFAYIGPAYKSLLRNVHFFFYTDEIHAYRLRRTCQCLEVVNLWILMTPRQHSSLD